MIAAHPVGNTLKRMAAQVLAVSLVFLLFLPFIGPQLDHHFAERRPDHVHVYLGDVLPDHIGDDAIFPSAFVASSKNPPRS